MDVVELLGEDPTVAVSPRTGDTHDYAKHFTESNDNLTC